MSKIIWLPRSINLQIFYERGSWATGDFAHRKCVSHCTRGRTKKFEKITLQSWGFILDRRKLFSDLLVPTRVYKLRPSYCLISFLTNPSVSYGHLRGEALHSSLLRRIELSGNVSSRYLTLNRGEAPRTTNRQGVAKEPGVALDDRRLQNAQLGKRNVDVRTGRYLNKSPCRMGNWRHHLLIHI